MAVEDRWRESRRGSDGKVNDNANAKTTDIIISTIATSNEAPPTITRYGYSSSRNNILKRLADEAVQRHMKMTKTTMSLFKEQRR